MNDTTPAPQANPPCGETEKNEQGVATPIQQETSTSEMESEQGDLICLLESMQVIEPERPLLTKRRIWNPETGKYREVSYGQAKWFRQQVCEVRTLDAMQDLLTWLLGQPYLCIVHGLPISETWPSGEVRLRRANSKTDAAGTVLVPATLGGNRLLNWLILDADIDDLVVPGKGVNGHREPATPEEIGIAVLQRWNIPELLGVSCLVVLSSGQAVKRGVRARLIFRLDRSVSRQYVSDWAGWKVVTGATGLDPAIYRTAQVVYCAAPIEMDVAGNRLLDVLPRRIGRLSGARETVAIPEVPEAHKVAQRPPGTARGSNFSHQVVRAFCQSFPIEDLLSDEGYQFVGHEMGGGQRWQNPEFNNAPGIEIHPDGKLTCYEELDALATQVGESVGAGGYAQRDAFDVFRILRHERDWGRAFAAAERELGWVSDDAAQVFPEEALQGAPGGPGGQPGGAGGPVPPGGHPGGNGAASSSPTLEALTAAARTLAADDLAGGKALIAHGLVLDAVDQNLLMNLISDTLGVPMQILRSYRKELKEVQASRAAKARMDRNLQNPGALPGEPLAFKERFHYVRNRDLIYDLTIHDYITRAAFEASFSQLNPEAGKISALDFALLKTGWMEQYAKETYWPSRDPQLRVEIGAATCLNRYRGPDLLPEEGDVSPWLEHLATLGIKPTELEHILDMLAWNVQHPHLKVRHALVLGGYPGIGKDLALLPFLACFGSHNIQTITGADLLQGFNGFMSGNKILNIQEVNLADHKDAQHIEEKLKQPIADNTMSITLKGVDTQDVPNFLQVIITTNHDHPFKIGPGDRRYFMVWCSAHRDGRDQEAWATYYHNLVQWMENGGFAKVYYYLLGRDVSHFNPATPPPSTLWHESVMESSRTRLEDTLVRCVEDGYLAFGQLLATPEQLQHSLNIRMGLTVEGAAMGGPLMNPDREVSLTALGRGLAAVGCLRERIRDIRFSHTDDRKRRYWILRRRNLQTVHRMSVNERNVYLDSHDKK